MSNAVGHSRAPVQRHLESLRSLAFPQGSYFTTRQAAACGVSRQILAHHVRGGRLQRCGHGLYRHLALPLPEHSELHRLSLWSCDRAGRRRAVVSHTTALLLLEGVVTTVAPGIHLTVPPKFRKRPPPGVVLHYGRFRRRDVMDWGGFRVTSHDRTAGDLWQVAGLTDEVRHAAVKFAFRFAAEVEALRPLDDS